MKIAMLGAGAFGTALGGVLEGNGHDVSYYDPALVGSDLSRTIEGADFIVLCVPSGVVIDVVSKIPKDVPMIVTTKGIMDIGVFSEFSDWMVMSGPGYADDVKAKHDTIMTATDDRIVRLFACNYMSFDYTDDRKGVLLCGSLKNIYAIGAGYRNLICNSPEWKEYIRMAVSEMKAILQANGAKADTVNLACGVKDLELTCRLPSRNYEYGMKLANDSSYESNKTVEGVSALDAVKNGDIEIPDGVLIFDSIMDLRR